jgi:hypothetical protein
MCFGQALHCLAILKRDLVRSEHNMGQVASVKTYLGVDWLTVVKHLKPKAPFWDVFDTIKIFAPFEKADADGCHDVVSGVVKNFFFEYDAILPWVIGICKFKRFCAHDIIKLEIFCVCLNLDLQLSFRGVVGQVAFYEHDVAGVFFCECQSLDVGVVEA